MSGDRRLTARQLQVVRAVVDLGGTKRAAHQLGVHQRTVELHLAGARTREQVDTTAQLVRALSKRGEL